MTAFRFRLGVVLDARLRAEDDARAPFLAATRAHDVALAETDRLRGEFERASRAFAARCVGTQAGGVRDALVEIEVIADALARSQDLLRAAAERARAATTTFAAARRERRQVEALRDRALAAFEQEREARERAALDEANGARHNAATLFASSFHNSYVT